MYIIIIVVIIYEIKIYKYFLNNYFKISRELCPINNLQIPLICKENEY